MTQIKFNFFYYSNDYIYVFLRWQLVEKVHLALFSPQTVSAFFASKSKALGFNKG